MKLIAQDAADVNPQFFYDVNPSDGTATTPYKVLFTTPVPGSMPISDVEQISNSASISRTIGQSTTS